MDNMMRRATLWLDKATRQASRREAYTYRRDAQAGTINFVPGRLVVDEFGDGSTAISALQESLVGIVDELRFEDGSAFMPQADDEIDWRDDNDQLHTFLAVPIEEGRCYRYTDQTRLRLRIFVIEKAPNTENP